MTVKTTYKKGSGKDYVILSRSGSSLIQKVGLQPLLDNEKAINNPANSPSPGSHRQTTRCISSPASRRSSTVASVSPSTISPRHKAPNMIDGTIWVDADTHTLVQVEGIASRGPSVFAGTTKMMRRYANMHGYFDGHPRRAESSSQLFGRTVIIIDYGEYHFQIRRESSLSPRSFLHMSYRLGDRRPGARGTAANSGSRAASVDFPSLQSGPHPRARRSVTLMCDAETPISRIQPRAYPRAATETLQSSVQRHLLRS